MLDSTLTRYIRLFLTAACAAITTIACAETARADDRPNIVILLADDMGYSDIGCYGGEIPTPHLDKLAAGGLRFTEFYNTSRCCPTRASLLTGLYPHEAGVGHMVYRNRGPGYLGHLNDKCVTLAEVLKPSGYQTYMTGKWHVGHAKGQWPRDRGFERFYGIHIHVDSYFKVLKNCPVYHSGQLAIAPTENPPNTLHPDKEWYSTDVFTDWALKFLDESDRARPFLMYVAYNAPHWPLEAPQENIEHFRDDYHDGWDQLRRERLERMIEMEIVPPDTELPPSENLKWKSLPPDGKRNSAFRRAIYAAQIERLDQNIGRLVEKLRKLGELENTLLVFLSDNGCADAPGPMGYNWKKNRIANYSEWRKDSGRSVSQGREWACASNTPFRLYKRWEHEGGIATPMIAHWPSVIKNPGGLTRQVGHVIDIMATCCDIADVTYPEKYMGHPLRPMRGISLLPTFRDFDQSKPRTVFWEHERHAAVRDGNWKLVTKNARDPQAWELYNLARDRVEMHNLADEQPKRVETLRKQWHRWAEDVNVLPFPEDR